MTISLQGNLTEETLAGLQQRVEEARGNQLAVAVDMSEVTLVDRKAVEYLSRHAGSDFRLINCPSYLFKWISMKVDS